MPAVPQWGRVWLTAAHRPDERTNAVDLLRVHVRRADGHGIEAVVRLSGKIKT